MSSSIAAAIDGSPPAAASASVAVSSAVAKLSDWLSSVARSRRAWARSWSGRGLAEQRRQQLAGALRIPAIGVQFGGPLQPGRSRPAAIVGRRLPERQLDQLGGRIRRAPGARQLGGGVELGGDRRIRAAREPRARWRARSSASTSSAATAR